MKCPSCNHDLPNGALFCPECGTKLNETAVESANTQPNSNEPAKASATTDERDASHNATDPAKRTESDDTAPSPHNGGGAPDGSATTDATDLKAHTTDDTASTSSKPSISERFKALDKKIRYGIVGGAAAIVVIICVAVGMSLFGGPSTDEAKTAFMQSDLATNGAVSSDYTNETPYEVTDFKIDKTDDSLTSEEQRELARTWYGTDQIKTVTCSGTVANESFETTFSALVYLAKSDSDWVAIGSPDIISEETKPLKGVDTLEESTSEEVSYADFSSTLDEANGTYTSTASGTQTYSFWFGTDTATVQQSFSFDPTYGWKTAGDMQISDENTEWDLAGKTFECSKDASSGHFDGTITFGAVEGESATADYSLAFDADSARADNYNDGSVNGTATGRITHDFGKASFDIQLEDDDNSVTLSCSCYSYGSSDGNNEIYVTGDTETVIYTSTYIDKCISFTSYAFEEKIDTSA